MEPTVVRQRLAALLAETAMLGRAVAEGGAGWSPEEAFEVAGGAQRLATSADGLVAVAGAWGARVELRLTGDGPVDRVHPVGFVDAMAPAEMSLATGLTEGVAGRKAALGAALGERFPRVRDLVLAGDLPAASAHKVVDACAGLDAEACAAVDADLAPGLAGLDPASVTSTARRVATRVAADQVAAQAARNRRARTVEVRPSDDGLTAWWALLPTAESAAMWSAVNELAGEHRRDDPGLGLDEARADALTDLVLRNVTVSASVTLGVPVVTGAEETGSACGPRTPDRIQLDDDDTVVDHATGEVTRVGDLRPADREALSTIELPAPDDPCGGLGAALPEGSRAAVTAEVVPGLGVSGVALAGLGWVPADVVAGLLRTLPVEVARAVLDADTGTLVSTTASAYRPPKELRKFVTTRDGRCRMWGCARPAAHVDLDHTRPWPRGSTSPRNLVALCRRHHRMKQRGRWRYRLHPDGTVTWVSSTGATRTTEPQHRAVSLPAAVSTRHPSQRDEAHGGGVLPRC